MPKNKKRPKRGKKLGKREVMSKCIWVVGKKTWFSTVEEAALPLSYVDEKFFSARS